MGSLYPAGQRRGRSRIALSNCITWMVANSLVLYFAGMFVQRLWALLHSDIGQLIRRV
jgi:hypothetical protein